MVAFAAEFREHSKSVSARDLMAVEFRLRNAKKKLMLLQDSGDALKSITTTAVASKP
jgi:hypothetical protein